MGLDPDGALYKIYNDLSSTTGSEKKTRVNEDSSDLQTMINNLDETLPLATRRKYLYDNINIPQCIAYLAAMSAISDWDIGDKNMYMYRDSNISGEWCVLPWDLDLSWGREWYGDDTIYNNNIFTFKPTTNRLFDLFYAVPEVKMMYMRRLRTNMDNFIQPPNTHQPMVLSKRVSGNGWTRWIRRTSVFRTPIWIFQAGPTGATTITCALKPSAFSTTIFRAGEAFYIHKIQL